VTIVQHAHARVPLALIVAPLVLAMGAPAQRPPAQRPPARPAIPGYTTYTNTARRYALTYPAAWISHPTHTRDRDVWLDAPGVGETAEVQATGQVLQLTDAQVRQILDQLLAQGLGGTPVPGSIRHAIVSLSGLRFRALDVQLSDPHGRMAALTLLGASYRHITYLFLGGYRLGAPLTPTWRAQVRAILRSITIARGSVSSAPMERGQGRRPWAADEHRRAHDITPRACRRATRTAGGAS
jgi:hypothetical protein